MDKEEVVYKNGILLVIKKNDISFATTWMEQETIMLSEITQSEEDKNMISLVEFKTKNR